jgi:arsenate reductase
MSVTIYHNPRCSKSRETLELLQKKGFKPEIIEYLKDPPSRKQLKEILHKLGLSPRQLMRTKEPVYQEKQLDNKSLTNEQLISAMLADPVLIERPIVLANGKVALGRPPENVTKIL